MEYSGYFEAVLRWGHIFAGIIWLGMLYYFNFVQLPFMKTLDAGTRRVVISELSPRALYWFRWSSLYAYCLGLILLALVFYHGGLLFDQSRGDSWGAPQYVMLGAVLLGFPVYDRLAKSSLAKRGYLFALIAFLLITAVYLGLTFWAGFAYRAALIHMGFLFGTIMAANVWNHIGPSQKKLFRAMREGSAPDPAWMELSLLRSRHILFLSLPLLWTMINLHTVSYAGLWFVFPIVVLCSWGLLGWLYAKAEGVRTDG